MTNSATQKPKTSKLLKNTAFCRLLTLPFVLLSLGAFATGDESWVLFRHTENAFPVVTQGKAAPILVSSTDYEGVIKVSELFANDIERVTGIKPEIFRDRSTLAQKVIIVGTLGKSPIIDELVKTRKLDTKSLEGKWETYRIFSIHHPVKGIDDALVIVGSDKRGTIYGMFDLSEKMGVSPWYWWADVPVKKQQEIYVSHGTHTAGTPKVKYRGIFINDEGPALEDWVYENFGSFNHAFYEHVFELILRLKGNFLWPAMWGKSFFEIDSLNAPLADLYGVVISTSHHEPMMRTHSDWSNNGVGPWNYEKNEEELRKFWRKGIERMGDKESIVTVGMRGDGDEAMSEETVTELLERIVMDQRSIIEETTEKPAAETPQLWALYKEVQEYYNQGMEVPEDITLLLCDDNWGNVRVLPKEEKRSRVGGYGMYYHYDFVGGPVSYKWLNVTQIEKVWEQMSLSYEYGVDRIWLVNVGDLKPMELPMTFFLDMAWDPEAMTIEKLAGYHENWAARQFGNLYAKEIGELLAGYTKYNARRHPEMLSPELYSLMNYREFETVVNDYNKLADKAKTIYSKLDENTKDAYYQLVLSPIQLCANLNELYFQTAKNRLYAEQNRASTNSLAEDVERLFNNDAKLTDYYHTEMSDGKWNHIMKQTHIGYTSWNQPDKNYMPEVKRVKIDADAGMGIMLEYSDAWWPHSDKDAKLPAFDRLNDQEYYIEIFNKGKQSLEYELNPGASWIKLSETVGETATEKRIMVSIDWALAPAGKSEEVVQVSGAGQTFSVQIEINNMLPEARGFIENNGVISMEAANYTKATGTDDISWITVPNLGRTHSGITVKPSDIARIELGPESPYLEYEFFVFDGDTVDVTVYLSPTLNFRQTEGLLYAISIDNEEPQIINMHQGEEAPDWTYPSWWNNSVTESIKRKSSRHIIHEPGNHVLKFWMIDPGVVLQKIVIDRGGLRKSYLGPVESVIR